MFVVNEDNSIYATRGDIVFFSVSAEDNGVKYTFKAGDVLRIKIYGKKDAENVVLQKDFPVTENTSEVEIYLTEEDTKIGEVISKPKDYWYEVELNPDEEPQTIIGYDEDGAKIFKLFPEGDDIESYEPDPEDFPVVDEELDMSSPRPVSNSVIARAFANLEAGYEAVHAAVSEIHVTPQMFGAVGDGVADDTEAIQKAINSGKDVFLPEGTYYTTSTITISEAQKVHGVGEKTVIHSTAEVAIETTHKGVVVEHLKFIGNGSNTCISAYQSNNTIRDISMDGFSVGIKNKNSDYMGSVRIERVNFDNTETCFSCSTLCNGLVFDKCVAYRFTAFIAAYWMEGVTLNDCFIEKGNDNSAVIRQLDGKSLLAAMGVTFNGCYIEGVDQLFVATNLVGTINLFGNWLKVEETLYTADATQTSATRFNISGNSFCVTSSSQVCFAFADEQVAIVGGNHGTVIDSGHFYASADNFSGAKVYMMEDVATMKDATQLIHKKTFSGTTDANGMLTLSDFSAATYEILGISVHTQDYAKRVCGDYCDNGNTWQVYVKGITTGEVHSNTAVHVYVFYCRRSEMAIE